MDKREYLSAEWFGLNSALPSMIRSNDGIMTGLGILLVLSGSQRHTGGPLFGRWAGDRLAIIGDYYQGTVAGYEVGQDDWGDVARQQNGWVDISEHVRKLLETSWELTLRPSLVEPGEARSILQEDGTIIGIPEPEWLDPPDNAWPPEPGSLHESL